MKITITATVPDELAQKWLQHMRDFDVVHPNCHFTVLATTDLSVDGIMRTLDIDPPLNVKKVLR